jgi:prepilin-type processing-associated H-X9-DG protein
MRTAYARRGLSAVETIVILVLVLIVFGCLLIAVPRSRERSRSAACQGNLMQIGFAMSLYHQAVGHFPTVALDAQGPITAMLENLAQPDFVAVDSPKTSPTRRLTGPPPEHRILGLICPTDRNAFSAPFPAPVSYRANTGDATDGSGGPFAIGKTATLAEVESADGAAYTAAFAERLIGDGRMGVADVSAYVLVPGPVGENRCSEAPTSSWKGDAGSSWYRAEWRSSLYSHRPPPQVLSCIAEDGRTAYLGASSDHAEGVNVLMLDGSLRTYRPSVEPNVWRALGTIGGTGR